MPVFALSRSSVGSACKAAIRRGDPVCNFTPPQPPPPPSAEKEYIAKDKQRALKQANIAFPSARESRQARPHGARAATDSVRSRSLTPAPLTKRTRSPSAQRSPRSAGQKNARVSAKEATCAPVKAVPDVEKNTTTSEGEEEGMDSGVECGNAVT